jgi:predicted HTH domain antitoxin
MTLTISRTDLARRTREAIEHAQRGEAVFIESYGTEQAAIIDAKEYHLLRAVAVYRNRPLAPVTHAETAPRGLMEDEVQARVAAAGGDRQEAWIAVIAAYLDGDISLGRAALLLGVSRFDLQAHFNRLGLPSQPGPLSLNEAKAEYTAIQASDAR